MTKQDGRKKLAFDLLLMESLDDALWEALLDALYVCFWVKVGVTR